MGDKKTEKNRNSNIELLRIMAIIMIISYHFVVHGYFSDQVGVINSIFLDIISSGGKIGVNIFCIIMGYFAVQSQYNSKKILLIEIQVLFYSLLGLVLAVSFCRETVSLGKIVVSLFPAITEHYWFFSAYFIVFLFSKYFNVALKSISKKEYVNVLLLCYVLWGAIPFFTLRENSGLFWNQLIWFFVMYLSGAYIRLYPPKYAFKVHFAIIVVCYILLVASFIGLEYLATQYSVLSKYTTYLRWSNSPIAVLVSISSFCIAISYRERNNRVINTFASMVFGIYLFHENVFISDIIWRKLFNCSFVVETLPLFIKFLSALLFILITGGIIDIIRKKTEWILYRPLLLISNKLSAVLSKIFK